jgi:hypothetical protein
MASARILVTVEHQQGIGGVVREGRHAWLSDRVPRPVTRLDDHRPVVIGLEQRALQGGLLPPGAVDAWVVDDRGQRHRAETGGGAWAIVLDHQVDGRAGPVCFRDGAGALLAPGIPTAWARTRVLDADEPCPACDSTHGWDEVVANDTSRGTRGLEEQPAPFVVCRACGHEYSVGVFYGGLVTGEPDAHEFARMTREAEESRLLDTQMALADLAFAVFVARGCSGRIGGWGSSNHVLTRVEVEHGAAAGEPGPRLRITTERERHRHESEAALARSALHTALHDVYLNAWPQRSSAGLAIWLDAVERQARRAAARSIITKRTMLVDGEPMPFVTAACDAHCSAAGRRNDLLLLVTAHDVDLKPVELVSVSDPLAALAPM